MVSLYKKDPLASFGFVGSASEGEPAAVTTRFRIYAFVMAGFFPGNKFLHAEHPAKSIYVIFNRNNRELELIQKIEAMANLIYDEDPPIQFTASTG